MALSNYQLSYNGLTIGAGTDVQLVGIDGLRALPGIRSSDVARPRADGSFGGLNFMGERIVTLQLLVMVTVANPWETVLEQLSAAFLHISDPGKLLPLQFQLPGQPALQIIGRPTRYHVPVDVPYAFHKAAVAIEMSCPDPLIYAAASSSVSAGLPNPTSGAVWPVTWPMTYGSSSGGALTVVNSGNWATPLKFTIQGPCVNPWVSLGSAKLTFNLTLASTDTLTVDTGAHTITLNGTANRYNTLAVGSQWFTAAPGSSTVNFGSGDSTQVTATCTATYSSAWASI